MDDFDRLAKRVEEKGKKWSQKDIDEYFKISEEEIKGGGEEQKIYKGHRRDTVLFFEGETVRITYENGLVIPKDFGRYEKELRGLINYIDEVIRNPLESDPKKGLDEIAGLKDVMFSAIEGIDTYFSDGGIFHKKELQVLRNHLDGRLEMFVGPITKLGNLIRKG